MHKCKKEEIETHFDIHKDNRFLNLQVLSSEFLNFQGIPVLVSYNKKTRVFGSSLGSG